MKKRHGTAKPKCDQCGQEMARVTYRPPEYRCGTCDPLRVMRREASWKETFGDFSAMMAHPRYRRLDGRRSWCFVSTQHAACVLEEGYGLDANDTTAFMVEAAAMVAWAASRSVYRMHPEMLRELQSMPGRKHAARAPAAV